MRFHALAALPLLLALPAAAQEATAPVTPSSVIAAAAPEEWQRIAAEDLLVMELAPDAAGNPRTVVIQLIPPPFSQPWVENIRTLARAQYWDGSTINRVQDNYVVQWGQPDAGFGGTVRPVPEGVVSPQAPYVERVPQEENEQAGRFSLIDSYAEAVDFVGAMPIAQSGDWWWPVHCYGAVGVGRDVAPDTGDGSQLYAVIGHAPRQLDRNIAVVGRVIEGIQHLASLPRGTGELSFYETEEELVPIMSVRIAADMPEPLQFEYLSTESDSFARLVHVRANRQDDFYNIPAGGVDICNIPVPIRAVTP